MAKLAIMSSNMARQVLRLVRRDRPQTARDRRVRVPRSTVALLAVSILLPLLLFALAAYQNRRDVETAAVRRVERTVRILHEQALKVFDTQELVIDQLNTQLRHFDWTDRGAVSDLHAQLAHLQALLPQVATIAITDADGHVRVSSRSDTPDTNLDLSDRDYFQTLKQRGGQTLPVISPGIVGRLSHEQVFNISARLAGPDPGRFIGVITVAIAQSYFVDVYRENQPGAGLVLILAHQDGGVLASDPPMTQIRLPAPTLFKLALEGRSHGMLLRPTLINGSQRIIAYEKCGAYPIVVGFGINWKHALTPWWRNMWGYGLVALLSSMTLLGVSGFAIRRIALEAAATVRWRRAADRLESETSERAKVEEQLRQSQKMEAVGRLTGGIAHDFNNLLTVVIGSLDMLSRRMKDAEPRHRTLIANAVDGATRAAALTARLLAFSRQHPLDPKALDANAVVRSMSSLLQRTLGENVNVDFVFADDLWTTFVDPNQLENAILNLAVNAVDAMPRGGCLTIRTANVTLDPAYCARHGDLAPGDFVKVAVSDTGTGMTPEIMAHAFEPFFTTKPVGKGTGLGLSQVYGFARQSRGHATIESELGRGTTIELLLPRRAVEPEAAAPSTAGTTELVAAPHAAKILIVEDDDLVRVFSTTALRDAGYVVVEAATGPDGLKALCQNPDVSLLFTDIVLKGPMNGRELADQVAVLRSDLPVLFTTGYTKEALLDGDTLAIGTNFIGKPFTTADLTAKIAALLLAEVPEVRRSAVG